MAIRARSRHEDNADAGLQDHPEQTGVKPPVDGDPFAAREGGPLDTSAMESAGNGADHSPEQHGGEGTSTDQKKPKRTDAEKSAAFSKLMSNRVSDALEAMRLMAHLANPSQYKWTKEQEEKVFGALETKTAELKAMFAASREPAVDENGKPVKRARQLLLRV